MTPSLDAVAVGHVLPPLTYTVTRKQLVKYAGAAGDFNAIHWNDRVAHEVGLPDVIAHGMFTMASAARVVTDWVGDPGRVTQCEVRFTRHPAIAPGPAAALAQSVPPAKRAACTGTPVVEVDARGLEPPQPLVKILEALESLPAGTRLRARTDRRPMHLYAQLEQRGFTGESVEQADGSFVTIIQPFTKQGGKR